ncbi:MAG: hypothetical protein ACE5GJ_15030 [Gemmatimonadota bacterium]
MNQGEEHLDVALPPHDETAVVVQLASPPFFAGEKVAIPVPIESLERTHAVQLEPLII